MKTTAKLNHLRIAPRKVRLIADMIRNKKVGDAKNILNFSIKKGSLPLLKLLNSAVSNASNSFQAVPENLYVSKITVDEGRKLKRWRARARGAAGKIQKKTSSITIILEEIEHQKGAKKKAVVAKKSEKPSNTKEKKGYQKKFVEETGKLRERNVGGGNKIFRRKSI